MNSFVFTDNLKKPFSTGKVPALYFGEGSLSSLSKITAQFKDKNAALFTGKSFLKESGFFNKINKMLADNGIKFTIFTVPSEPSPAIIDDAAAQMTKDNAAFVIAVGGGSVIDSGKAASIMALNSGSVKEYLEGVGTRQLNGVKLPFIAIPTTSGTGSEATKNSVISVIASDGFKKSLRHDCMIPDYAVIDPLLIASCPASVTASSGMDAVTQLIESFVSVNASVFTDSLAAPAIEIAGNALEKAFFNGSDIEARSAMAWAAFVSGVTLANAGLGVVHGIASPAGGFSSVPHGVVCASLAAPATKYITELLLEKDAESIGIKKYARAAALFTGKDYGCDKENCKALVNKLFELTQKFNIPTLSKYGFDKTLAEKTAKASDGKNSPVKLTTDDIYKIIAERI